MKKSIIYCAIALFAAASCGKEAPAPAQRWSEERANAWYAEQEWPVGFNYVAATAINQFEMWQAESFDPKTIDYEMSKAEELGFNTVRIFLHDMVWEADPAGFKQRIDAFLGICRSHGIKTIVTFFTNGGRFENPQLGKQPESIQGIHNSQWIQSPGAPSVNDPASWPRLERYVKDILTTFRDDDRILFWCLYNEPENFKQGAQSLPLLREVFKWGREANPSQPLSSPLWICPGAHGTRSNFPIVSFLGENCDIMPILKRERVGAISWGLTAGKCNFHLQWSSKAGDPEPEIWFHDIFRLDGTPYSQREVDFIRSMTQDKNMN